LGKPAHLSNRILHGWLGLTKAMGIGNRDQFDAQNDLDNPKNGIHFQLQMIVLRIIRLIQPVMLAIIQLPNRWREKPPDAESAVGAHSPKVRAHRLDILRESPALVQCTPEGGGHPLEREKQGR
jgi:hypothetical protein